MRSMTGFGRADARFEAWQLTIEARAVNHRGLDVRLRVPHGIGSLGVEEALRQLVATVVARGAVTIAVHLVRDASGEAPEALAATEASLAREVRLAAMYYQALRAEAERLHAPTPALEAVWGVLHAAARGPKGDAAGSLAYGAEAATEGLVGAMMAAAREALAELAAARLREGMALARDLAALREALAKQLATIEAFAAEAPARAATQFAAKMRQLGAAELTPDRVAVEAAALAARMDIHEEVARAKAHLSAFEALCGTAAPGRRLDFLAQELLRELSTMGAKSSDREILSAVVAAKAELDRIREQVQNVE